MSGPEIARVRLELRSERELVQLARLVVSGVATVSEMGLEEAEDCRAAIDELCSSLVEAAAEGAVLRLDIVTFGDRVEATGEVAVVDGGAADELRREISEMILDAVTDEHEIDLDAGGGRATFRFVRTSRRVRDAAAADQEGGAA